MLNITHFKSDKYGSTVCILGAVYGDDVCGTIAINKLISDINSGTIRLTKGALYLAPIVNNKAYEQKKRFCEVDLNRVFKRNIDVSLHEEVLAQELMGIINKSDLVLDLQSSATRDLSFIFQDSSDRKTLSLVKSLPINNVILGRNKIYKNIRDVSIMDYIYSINSYGVVIKCGKHKNPQSVEVAYKNILSALNHLSMIECEEYIYNHFIESDTAKKKYFMLNSFVRKPKGGRFLKDWINGEKLLKGQEIAKDSQDVIYKTDRECVICLPCDNVNEGEAWYYLGDVMRGKGEFGYSVNMGITTGDAVLLDEDGINLN